MLGHVSVDSLSLVLARALRAERARAGLSQSELAARLGTSQTRFAALESGARKLYAAELPDVCRALGVTFADLLYKADPEDRSALGL
jgi:transcriptional regulator with XRE-family HTH domain